MGCGKQRPKIGKSYGEYEVSKFKDIIEKIIPFFDKYLIVGDKSKDYFLFKQAAEIMIKKGHLTDIGLQQIIILK